MFYVKWHIKYNIFYVENCTHENLGKFLFRMRKFSRTKKKKKKKTGSVDNTQEYKSKYCVIIIKLYPTNVENRVSS
jgi:hypothetical protein